MSKSKAQLQSESKKLRNKIAETEAVLSGLKSKLAKIEGQLTGEPAPETGLEMLWKAALPISRTRSSTILCRKAWYSIPVQDRPKIADAVAALHAWNRCEEWRKDGNQYAIALDRWIKERRWENLPEDSQRDVSARYRVAPKPVPQTAPEDAATPEDLAAVLAALKPRRMNS